MTWKVALLGALLIVSCSRSGSYSPPRPARLPPEAIYAGGAVGGDWVACDGGSDGALHCRIFDHESGDLRRESWFRYCPQDGQQFAGSVEIVDAKGAHTGGVTLKRDRPDVFHAPPNMPSGDRANELEHISEEYYEDGVHADCSPADAE